jgi:hypothetical protein
MAIGSLFIGHWVLLLAIAVLVVLPFWRIVGKTGMPAALSLLFFIPIANVVFLWVLAFAEWPALKRNPR